jgi:D-serine deaminase-like pyridoxal phosphate-dependent protein
MQRVADLDTPVIVVDLDVLEGNIRRLQEELNALGLSSRPHIKTHKIPSIGHMQVGAGAAGITCQKLGEAEVFADAGFTDILVPYNIIGAPKLERLTRLARRVTLTVAVDSEVTARGIAEACQEAGTTANLSVAAIRRISHASSYEPGATASVPSSRVSTFGWPTISASASNALSESKG